MTSRNAHSIDSYQLQLRAGVSSLCRSKTPARESSARVGNSRAGAFHGRRSPFHTRVTQAYVCQDLTYVLPVVRLHSSPLLSVPAMWTRGDSNSWLFHPKSARR